ncbi:MAG: DUF937 domain-containing protein [Saprospiraceae bacterium]|nr:DUF937 domain-containing protein [Saprospiraceae bacterium]MBP7699662.1 DUF937 domain-containing protein [Saprospiraceae bacterium]
MSNLFEMFEGQLNNGLADYLSQSTGIDNTQQTVDASNAIFSTLLGAMSKNAATPEGASALNNALERDHDGSIFDNALSVLMGSSQPQNTNALNGSGILGHILGGNASNVLGMLSKVTGLDSGKLMSLMISLAPVIMGLLGKARAQNGIDASGIGGLLGSVLGGGNATQQANSNPLMDILNRVLDKDGDGNMLDDLLGGAGGNILGGLLGGKR